MSQKELGRIHVRLPVELYNRMEATAASVKEGYPLLGVANILVACVSCALPKLEEKLPKRKPFKLGGVTINPLEIERVDSLKMHLYFGQHRKLIPRIQKLAKTAGVSASFIVRSSVELCAAAMEKSVPKGKPFKVLGTNVTFEG